MRRTPRNSETLWRLTAGAVVALLVGCLGWRILHFDLFGGRGVLLKTDEGPATLWLFDIGGMDSTLELHVDGNARHRSEYVIDKSTYSTLRFIRYNGRVLVANGEFIFAAYDPAADAVIGYDDLPFKIWEGQGEVLASYVYGSEPASVWHNSRRVHEHQAPEKRDAE